MGPDTTRGTIRDPYVVLGLSGTEDDKRGNLGVREDTRG